MSSSMWKESEEKFKWKKDRQFSELFIKYESSQNLLETVSDEGSSIVTELIDLILVRWSMIFCNDSKFNFRSLLCFREFLLGNSPKRNNIFKALYANHLPKGFYVKICWFVDFLLHFMWTQIWYLSHCTAWWLFGTALLHFCTEI